MVAKSVHLQEGGTRWCGVKVVVARWGQVWMRWLALVSVEWR